MKFISLLLFLTYSLLAYNDSDMDGVDDKIDKCLHTPFMDLVNKDGCTKSSLISPHHFDIIFGTSYLNYDKTDIYTTSLQLDYFYKNFSLSLSSSYFTNANSTTDTDSENKGMNDSYVGLSYRIKPLKNLTINSSLGTLIATYNSDTNKDDYIASIGLTYHLSSFRIMGSYRYTLIGDTSTTIDYQDSDAYTLGVGYYINNKLYLSTSYKNSKSIYVDNEDIKSLSVYSSYNFNLHWFSTLNYSYGLSESANDNYLSLRLGYYL